MEKDGTYQTEMQQVGAYGTKHKTHQPDVPLLEERPEDDVRRVEGKGPAKQT